MSDLIELTEFSIPPAQTTNTTFTVVFLFVKWVLRAS